MSYCLSMVMQLYFSVKLLSVSFLGIIYFNKIQKQTTDLRETNFFIIKFLNIVKIDIYYNTREKKRLLFAYVQFNIQCFMHRRIWSMVSAE